MTGRIVDLTYPIHDGMMTFPVHWHPVVEVVTLGRHGIEDRETRKLVLGTHTGTHCDAPRHFIAGGKTLDQIPLDVFVGPAVVLDFSDCEPLEEIGVERLKAALGERRPDRLILRFDWSDHWGQMTFYNSNPYISSEAAQWLVDRGLKLLGMDTAMPDHPANGRGSEVDSPIHQILLGNGVILLEYLCNLRELQSDEVQLFALPLKIDGSDGAPVRCIAIDEG